MRSKKKKAEIARDLFSAEVLPASFPNQWQPSSGYELVPHHNELDMLQEGGEGGGKSW